MPRLVLESVLCPLSSAMIFWDAYDLSRLRRRDSKLSRPPRCPRSISAHRPPGTGAWTNIIAPSGNAPPHTGPAQRSASRVAGTTCCPGRGATRGRLCDMVDALTGGEGEPLASPPQGQQVVPATPFEMLPLQTLTGQWNYAGSFRRGLRFGWIGSDGKKGKNSGTTILTIQFIMITPEPMQMQMKPG